MVYDIGMYTNASFRCLLKCLGLGEGRGLCHVCSRQRWESLGLGRRSLSTLDSPAVVLHQMSLLFVLVISCWSLVASTSPTHCSWWWWWWWNLARKTTILPFSRTIYLFYLYITQQHVKQPTSQLIMKYRLRKVHNTYLKGSNSTYTGNY
jgi:hypothetical protein